MTNSVFSKDAALVQKKFTPVQFDNTLLVFQLMNDLKYYNILNTSTSVARISLSYLKKHLRTFVQPTTVALSTGSHP